jgi:tryptophan synthase beta chain
MNEALRDWVANVHDTFYIIGTAAGPHPYPELVRDFQSVIGKEAARNAGTHRAPARHADRGGGRRQQRHRPVPPFLDDKDVQMIGVEAGGHGVDTDQHAASLTGGARHPAWQQDLSAAGRGRPDHRGALDQAGWIIPASGRNIAGCMKSAA